MLLFIPVFLCFTFTPGRSHEIHARDGCSNNFSKCSPQGASSANAPAVGSDLSPVYNDILSSIQGIQLKERDVLETGQKLNPRAGSNDFCCADGTSCLLLQELSLPFCYDKFTTNFYLPGGTYGTVVSGNYTSPNGDRANLLTGNFTLADGTSGNIYGSASSLSKPTKSTLTLPTQFTDSGVGAVIPFTALGEEVTFTTTIPGTTIPPSTISSETVSSVVVSGKTVVRTTSAPVATIPGTTDPPQTSTVTTLNGSSTGSAKSSASGAITSNPLRLCLRMFQAISIGFLLSVMINAWF